LGNDKEVLVGVCVSGVVDMVCLMQVNWLRSSVVRAYFAEVVNSSVDGVCLDALHVFLAMAGMTEESRGQH
jgi:hypothetical protein